MTLAAAFWPRRFPNLPPGIRREFETEPGTRVVATCHWQPEPKLHPTLILLHGLEGSWESGYMKGTAEKAFRAGFNVLRLNQRNCGGTELLTPTLYNSSLSIDIRAVINEMIERDQLPEIFAAGFSMGGNLVLKMAGEWGESAPPQLRGVIGICPAIELALCADSLAKPENYVYQRHFVASLKKRMLYKASLFPGQFPLDGLDKVRTVREFDDVITAKFCGFLGADDYYFRASAIRVAAAIRLPSVIITAQDDPMVPFESFDNRDLRSNANIEIIAPHHGGHCAFIASESGEDRFWVESRIVEICRVRMTAKSGASCSPGPPSAISAEGDPGLFGHHS
jgi:predicted alpha/beta-fold hydrolase